MKLNVKAFALTFALFLGLGLFLITFWIMLFDGATGEMLLIGKIYRGYNVSIGGAFIGLVWGFFDGLILGAIYAWLYNFWVEKFKKD